MSRVQVLDVGDRVQVLDTSDRLQGREGVVIRVADERHVVAIPGIGQIGGYERSDLERIGGDIQVGDWVRVSGTVEPFWSCEKEELDAEAGVIVDEIAEGEGDFLVYVLTEADVYECCTDQLTRITRAEALA